MVLLRICNVLDCDISYIMEDKDKDDEENVERETFVGEYSEYD